MRDPLRLFKIPRTWKGRPCKQAQWWTPILNLQEFRKPSNPLTRSPNHRWVFKDGADIEFFPPHHAALLWWKGNQKRPGPCLSPGEMAFSRSHRLTTSKSPIPKTCLQFFNHPKPLLKHRNVSTLYNWLPMQPGTNSSRSCWLSAVTLTSSCKDKHDKWGFRKIGVCTPKWMIYNTKEKSR